MPAEISKKPCDYDKYIGGAKECIFFNSLGGTALPTLRIAFKGIDPKIKGESLLIKKFAVIFLLLFAVSLTACTSREAQSEQTASEQSSEQILKSAENEETIAEVDKQEKIYIGNDSYCLKDPQTGMYFITDGDGKLYTDTAFEKVEYFGGDVFCATKDNIRYNYEISDGELLVTRIDATITILEREASVTVPIKDNDPGYYEEYMPLVDKAVEFLTAPYEDNSDVSRKKAELLGGKKPDCIFHVNVAPIYDGAEIVRIIPYCVFDGMDEKSEMTIEFIKGEGGEYAITDIYCGS